MTDEEMAEKYVNTLLNKDDSELDKFLDENLGDLKLNKKQAGTLLGIIKGVGICSFLEGLKAGRPKWHKVADGDLPKEEDLEMQVLCFTYDGYQLLSLFSDPKPIFKGYGVIAWCETPKYTEE